VETCSARTGNTEVSRGTEQDRALLRNNEEVRGTMVRYKLLNDVTGFPISTVMNVMYGIRQQPYKGLGKAAVAKSGPNNSKRVVWAISKFLKNLFCVFLLLTNVFSFYLCYTRMGRVREAGSHENGPKRCHW
jgi:hypothetical protein